MIRPERVVLRRIRRLLRPPVAMRLHVGRPANDLARGCLFTIANTSPTKAAKSVCQGILLCEQSQTVRKRVQVQA